MSKSRLVVLLGTLMSLALVTGCSRSEDHRSGAVDERIVINADSKEQEEIRNLEKDAG